MSAPKVCTTNVSALAVCDRVGQITETVCSSQNVPWNIAVKINEN